MCAETLFVQVLQHESQANTFLYVRTGDSAWMIGPIMGGERGWIRSRSAGTTCPADDASSGSWQFHDGSKWQDGQITVTAGSSW